MPDSPHIRQEAAQRLIGKTRFLRLLHGLHLAFEVLELCWGMALLKTLFARKPKFSTEIAPDQPFFAVGDLHGCIEQLRNIPTIASEHASKETPIVFVGDYVDRGPDSAAVLRWLFEQQTSNPDTIVCLMGNHERMMLDALAHPEKASRRWMRYGGMETTASFGVQPIFGQALDEEWVQMRDDLVNAMGADLLDWMHNLPLHWQSGNVFVCHAGAKPSIALDAQEPNTLLWGNEDFVRKTRSDGNWVLHGHTVVERAHAQDGRIAIDTGAYMTGILTCAHITQHGANFIPVTSMTV